MGRTWCRGAAVRYYLLTEQDMRGRWEYGVMVERAGEREEVPAIAPSRNGVQTLLNRMIRGRVTPAAARDVVEDWLSA